MKIIIIKIIIIIIKINKNMRNYFHNNHNKIVKLKPNYSDVDE